MQTTPSNIEVLLPFGEALRGFMEQSYISASDLKFALRQRGIFLRRQEKRDTVPILICCLLSPSEFEELRQRQENAEDNPKTITRAIPWKSGKSILEALPNNLNLGDLLLGDSVNYKVLGSPQFVPVENDRNNVVCEFEIEREDLSQNWATTKSNFKGKLRLEKPTSGTGVRFVLTNTAGETKDLNRRLVQSLTTHFKQAGDVSIDAEFETILFSSFSNERRIAFFRSLTRGMETEGFEFVEVTDYGIRPSARVSRAKALRRMPTCPGSPPSCA